MGSIPIRLRHYDMPMRTDEKRIAAVACLAVVGLVFLVYGGGFRSVDVVVPEDAKKPPVLIQDGPPKEPNRVAKSEWAVVKDVTFGGLAWDGYGPIKQTYTGEAPAAACPT